jgi:hypothetical protein
MSSAAMLGLMSSTKSMSAPLFSHIVSDVFIDGPAAPTNNKNIPQYSITRRAITMLLKLTGALKGTPPGGPSGIDAEKEFPKRLAMYIARGMAIKAAAKSAGRSN